MLIANGNSRIRRQLLSSKINDRIVQVTLACPSANKTCMDPTGLGLDALLPLYLIFHSAIIYLRSFYADDPVVRSSHDTILVELISAAQRWSISRPSQYMGHEQLFEYAVDLLRKYVCYG